MWVKLDDAMLDDEDVVAAGADGFALHAAALLYCGRNLTDGFVPYGKVALLLDVAPFRAKLAEIRDRLVGVGLWRDDPERGGYWLRSYLKYNPSREQVAALRSKRAAAGSRGGQQSGASRRAKPDQSNTGSNGEANASANSEQPGSIDKPKSNPAPAPVIETPPIARTRVQAEDVGATNGVGLVPFCCPPDLHPTEGMLASLRAVGCHNPTAEVKLYAEFWASEARREIDWTETGPRWPKWVARHEQRGCARKAEAKHLLHTGFAPREEAGPRRPALRHAREIFAQWDRDLSTPEGRQAADEDEGRRRLDAQRHRVRGAGGGA